MEAWTGAETNPPASPIFVPTLTRSPGETIGRAGAPRCWESGMKTRSGSGSSRAGSARVIFSSGGWTPPLNG
jgi:hypothetical protein